MEILNLTHSAIIGANAVINKSCTNYSVPIGIPAKVISLKGSEEFIKNPFYKTGSSKNLSKNYSVV